MTAPISLVLFDMEGVLSHYDRAVRADHLAALCGRPSEAVREAIWGSGLEARADSGEIGEDDYLAMLGNLLGCPISRDMWLASRRASITPNLETLDLAASVARNRAIAVLTNNCRLVSDHIGYLNPPVARVFGARVYATASFGSAKPAAQAYYGCLERLGARASETFFIDDSDANVRGALFAGLLAYKFVDADALAKEFRQRNLI
ncbi:hydrolase [Caballeronia novacaledonica]|uniref:Hydrolase n=1 Tax=Caballeronia novacaledonica TaxID=1544861 RepID=A0A2U3I2N5_9BURK|nr:HAD family hydrolase [Caballeronia novacaledonica]SPB14377.1 hydrolase [Caballeronia novacaledonica]